jgi:hypothetical protein
MNPTNRFRLTRSAIVLFTGGALLLGASLGCGDASAAEEKAPPAARSDARLDAFTGTFHAAVHGQRATLVIQRDGDAVRGKMDDLAFTGTVDGAAASGSVVEAGTGAVVAYELTPAGDGLDVKLTVTDPKTGRSAAAPAIHFARNTA